MESNDLSDRDRSRHKRPQSQRTEETEPSKFVYSSYITEAYDLIPSIGDGYRWYDYPYRLFEFLLRKDGVKVFPAFIRKWAASGINFLHPFNMHHRHQAWSKDDVSRNLFVDKGEHVTIQGIWAVELFPPSKLPKFERLLRKNGWERRDQYEENNSEVLERSRSIENNTWWQVIDLHQKDARWRAPNGITASLPSEFEGIGLRAIQIGTGLTAVVASFTLTEAASKSLDQVWHSQHEPKLQWVPSQGSPRSLTRLDSGIWKTQEARRNLHSAARDWLEETVSGFFAETKTPQPVLDLLLFDQFDPLEEPYVEQSQTEWTKHHSAFRALGIESSSVYYRVSPSFPKLVLSSHDHLFREPLADNPTWSIWGQHGAVVDALGNHAYMGFGTDTGRAIAYHVQNMYPLLIMLAVSEFIDVNATHYVRSRDRASTRHGKFKPSRLQELRETLLTLSLDITTVQRDIKGFWTENANQLPLFEYERSPRTRFFDAKRGHEPQGIASVNDRLKTEHKKRFQLLLEIDRDYRDILATVSSLGASADSTRTGRLALFVAFASLAVTVVTLLTSDIDWDSFLYNLEGIWDLAASAVSQTCGGISRVFI